MEIKSINDLKALFEKELNLKKNLEQKKRTNQLLKKVRQFTKSKDTFSSAKMYLYRRDKAIPKSFLEGASLLLQIEDDQLHTGTLSHFFHKAHNIYAQNIGLEFNSIKSICKLSIGKGFPFFMDSETTTFYYGPKTSPNFSEKEIHFINFSDINDFSDIKSEMVIHGPGITASHLEAEFEILQRKLISSTKKETRKPTVITTHKATVNLAAKKTSYIKIKRNLQESFSLQEGMGEPVERAGMAILFPVKELTLELHFPSELKKYLNDLTIESIAWPPGTTKIERMDYKRISPFLLDNNRCISIGHGSWQWKSHSPPGLGMQYGIAYRPYELQKILKEKNLI